VLESEKEVKQAEEQKAVQQFEDERKIEVEVMKHERPYDFHPHNGGGHHPLYLTPQHHGK